MRAIHVAAGFAAFASACGARSGLSVPRADGGGDVLDAIDVAVRDAPLADTSPRPDVPPVMACVTAWNACRPHGAGIQVSGDDLGQQPDVTWTGREILVVYDSNAGGNTLAALSPDGVVLSREAVGGTQSPRVAWNPRTNAGLVVMDSSLRWIGANGRVAGDRVTAEMPGSQLYGDVAPIEGGFLVVSGVVAYSRVPPLSTMLVPSEPARRMWMPIADPAPWSPPEIAIGDDGLARWFVSTAWHSSAGTAYRVNADGTVAERVALDTALPSDSHVSGAALRGDTLEVLIGTTSSRLLLVRVDASRRVTSIDLPYRSPRSGNGHLARMGNTILLAAERSDRATGVQVAPIEDDGSTGIPLLVGMLETQSPRLTATDRGFAIVWNQAGPNGLAAWAQIFECCVP